MSDAQMLQVDGTAVRVTHLDKVLYPATGTTKAAVIDYVVQVAPDVTGFVTKVYVHDNQHVAAGAPLFEIDRARFELALRQAEAHFRLDGVVDQLVLRGDLRRGVPRRAEQQPVRFQYHGL